MSSATFHKIREYLITNGYDLNDYGTPEAGQLIYEFIKENNLQVSQFKNNKESRYKAHGYKVKDAFKRASEQGKDIYMSYVNLGDIPLKSPDTVKLARKLESKIVEPNEPRRAKLEHGVTRNNLIHLHLDYAATKEPPKQIKLSGKVYEVNTVKVGTDPKWNEKYTYDEQLERVVKYLYKPPNAAGSEWHDKEDIRYNAYLEWYREQEYLFTLSPNQRKKLNTRTSWNKNIKVK